MLSKITLKLKSKKTGKAVEFVPGRIVVVVGPNGSGKTRLLNETGSMFNIGGSRQDSWREKRIVVDDVQLSEQLQASTLQDMLGTESVLHNEIKYTSSLTNKEGERHVLSYPKMPEMGFGREQAHTELREWVKQPSIYRSLMASLPGRERQSIVQQNNPNPQQKSIVPLYDVGFSDLQRTKFTKLLSEALGLYPVFDFLSGKVSLRLSPVPVPDHVQMTARDVAQDFMGQLEHVTNLSDGHQSVAGLFLACTASQYRLLLIDETEAFLHPPLQRLVGKRIAELADENDGTLIAVTHSDSVLEGCLATGLPLTILRMNNEGGEYSAEVLDPEMVRIFTRRPILRATSALEALFCQTAVVCEGESDYVVYSEINHRLEQAKDRAVPDSKFISTFGKNKVHHVIKPLRQMGIPAAAVCDFDLLTGDGFASLMEAANMPTTTHRQLRSNAGTAIQNLSTTDADPAMQVAERKKLAKNLGLNAFTGNDRVLMRDVLDACAQYGVFICPVGEIEQWYPACTAKERFVTEYFDYLGDDPESPDYKKPAKDGIWQFMRDIAAWTKDPIRKGMPYDKGA